MLAGVMVDFGLCLWRGGLEELRLLFCFVLFVMGV